MNQLEKFISQSKSISQFAAEYIDYLNFVLKTVDMKSLDALAAELLLARERGNTVFIIGNGGSASTATTMANDLGFDVIKKSGCDLPFRIFSLTDNNAAMTAIGNDVGYENLFVSQLAIHYRPGDMLLAISASGNSANILVAADWMKKRGGKVLSFVGFSGGMLKEISDVSVHVKCEKGEFGPVEDAHLALNHILAHWFQVILRGSRN
ncbi:MAG TPA: SIS domain-containing protein [Bdellovibrionota bacterium]|nr:SIS domain-containing protein [Bdellovibrionota bacterium]